MNLLTQISRLLVSVTFIFSGFVKLVDPLGSAYKFEEYFGADVLNLEFLSPYALQFSILLILAEIFQNSPESSDTIINPADPNSSR